MARIGKEQAEDIEHFDSHSDQNLSLFCFVIFCWMES
jgi:hypothetical protein